MARPSGVYNWSKLWDVVKSFMYLWETMGPCWFCILWFHLIEFNFQQIFNLISPLLHKFCNFVGLSFELL